MCVDNIFTEQAVALDTVLVKGAKPESMALGKPRKIAVGMGVNTCCIEVCKTKAALVADFATDTV